MPSQPIGTFGKVVRVAALAVAVLAVYALTTALVMLLASWMKGGSPLEPTNLVVGLLGGLAAWLIILVFHANRESVELTFSSRPIFLQRVQAELERLGYDVQVENDGRVIARPGFSSWLFGGNVEATVEAHSAKVKGPKLFLEMLRKRVRVDQVMDRAQRSAHQARLRQGQQLLKRVQIDLRVLPDQWDEVQSRIIEALRADGAEVVCEVSLMAQSETGIFDFTVEQEIRGWLKQKDIGAEIRKETLSV